MLVWILHPSLSGADPNGGRERNTLSKISLAMCSMGGQLPGLPQSPRDVEDYSIDVDRPGENPGYISLFFEV